jgi:hypothetical protein
LIKLKNIAFSFQLFHFYLIFSSFSSSSPTFFLLSPSLPSILFSFFNNCKSRDHYFYILYYSLLPSLSCRLSPPLSSPCFSNNCLCSIFLSVLCILFLLFIWLTCTQAACLCFFHYFLFSPSSHSFLLFPPPFSLSPSILFIHFVPFFRLIFLLLSNLFIYLFILVRCQTRVFPFPPQILSNFFLFLFFTFLIL